MFPIAHIAAPLLILAIYDKCLKAKENERIPSVYYIVIAIGGILPDLLGIHIKATGRATLSHSILLPLALLLLYLGLKKFKKKYSFPVFLLFIGSTIHFILDMFTAPMYPFYPLIMYTMNQFVLFPLYSITKKGTLYLNAFQATIWYGLGLIFFIGFLIVDKTPVIEKTYKKFNSSESEKMEID